jgi:FkbM family methyltransferase
MRIVLRLYTNNFSIYIYNNPRNTDNKNYYSQFGQDGYVFNNVFKNRKNGFFVDIGANHPTDCNNTYLLELNNWTGVAIEPQKELRELWPSIRKTPCLNYVVGNENKKIDFIEGDTEEHGLSGVAGFNKVKNRYKKISVDQKKLSDILNEMYVTYIDYLSIDVEGYEINVLKGIDFKKTDIKLIGIENDIGFKKIPIIGKRLGMELGNNTLRKYIENNGYTYIARIFCDDFFIIYK